MKNKFGKNLHSRSLAFGSAVHLYFTDILLHIIIEFCKYFIIIINFFFFLQNLDLTKHRLIYDGPLTMKLGDTKRFKTIDLHVVLLEDCIMLLQKQDDKYLLKFHTTTFGTTGAPQGQKFCHSPVIKFSTMLVRPVATGIYVIFCLFIIPIIFTLFSHQKIIIH